MAPPDISTYRPGVILLVGFTATFAALYLHQHYLRPVSPASDGGLHRSNAVRRTYARRRRRGDESGTSNSSGLPIVSEVAITRLLAREASDVDYGTFYPSFAIDALPVEALSGFRLLPSQLPPVTDVQSLYSVSESAAQEIQHRIQYVFMHSFMTQEYPHGHHIQGVEAEYLREQLAALNVDIAIVETCITDFNAGRLAGMPTADFIAGETSRTQLADTQNLRRLTEPLDSADGINDPRRNTDSHIPDTRETIVDDQSYASDRNLSDGEGDEEEVQDVMSLAYRVAEDNSRRLNYVHRGVMCNGCRVQPIQGIRYSCANCPDYDLCEDCEANQIHIKTHIFYKVRIPAPLLGYHKPTAPTWYPGKPHLLTEELREKFPNMLKQHLAREYDMESDELQAHWEQFICLATCSWTNDPIKLGVAIDRDGFDKCFCRPTSLRSPPPNLLYERLFAFYDTNGDGKIGFDEFLKGLVTLKDNSRHAKLRRIFDAYDLDDDGFVCRKDFLRLFRAYYSYSKEMAIASVAAFDDNQNDPYARDIDRDEVRRRIEGGRPISAIFEGSIPPANPSQAVVGKSMSPNAYGDLTIVDENGVLNEADEVGNHNDIISQAALASLDDRPLASLFPSFGTPATAYEAALRLELSRDLQVQVLPEDIFNALGRHIAFDEVTDPTERARIMYTLSQRLKIAADQNHATIRRRAIEDRWKKRKFYTNEEEGATAPPGYMEADSSDEDADHGNGVPSPNSISTSRRQSLRSRSSSKVRFEDDLTDTDYETRSNTSSRSIPVGERWGGYEIRDVEKDIGKEVLYQAIQQGFNDLLDPLFKEKEDLAIAADSTRTARRKWAGKSSEHGQAEHSSTLLDLSEVALLNRNKTDGNGPIPAFNETNLPNAPSSSAGLERGLPQNGQEPLPISNEDNPIPFPNRSVKRDLSLSASGPDPTMPQNRPSSPPILSSAAVNGPPAVLPLTSQTAGLTALNAMHPRNRKRKSVDILSQHLGSPLPPAVQPEPSAETLALWAKHNEVDLEAKQRGGHGKLNFEEFSAKMVEENSAGTAWSRDEDRAGEGEQKWGPSASLGRLWFVGTWIEQAAF